MNKTTNIGRVHRSGKRDQLQICAPTHCFPLNSSIHHIGHAGFRSMLRCRPHWGGGGICVPTVPSFLLFTRIHRFHLHRLSKSRLFTGNGEQPPRGWFYMVFSFLFFLYLPQLLKYGVDDDGWCLV